MQTGGVAGGVGAIALCAAGFFLWRRQRGVRKQTMPEQRLVRVLVGMHLQDGHISQNGLAC